MRDTKNFVCQRPHRRPRAQGDFSSPLFGTIYDPATAAPNPAGGLVLQPFAGNRIPSDRFDPVAQQVLQLYAAPNTNFNALASNFVNNPALKRTDDQFDIRIDHRLNDANNLFGRYSFGDATQLFPECHADRAESLRRRQRQRQPQPVCARRAWPSITSTPSPTGFCPKPVSGFTRTNYTGLPLGNGDPLLDKIIIPNQRYNDTIQTIPTFGISGITAIGPQGNVPNFSVLNNYQVSENLSYTLSGHTFKFGGDFIRRQLNNNFTGAPTGAFSFSGVYTTVNAAGAARPGKCVRGFPAGPAGELQLATFSPAASDAAMSSRPPIFRTT